MNQHKPTLADVIVLGAAQFGMDYGITNVSGKPSNQEIFKIPEYAWELGGLTQLRDMAPKCC